MNIRTVCSIALAATVLGVCAPKSDAQGRGRAVSGGSLSMPGLVSSTGTASRIIYPAGTNNLGGYGANGYVGTNPYAGSNASAGYYNGLNNGYSGFNAYNSFNPGMGYFGAFNNSGFNSGLSNTYSGNYFGANPNAQNSGAAGSDYSITNNGFGFGGYNNASGFGYGDPTNQPPLVIGPNGNLMPLGGMNAANGGPAYIVNGPTGLHDSIDVQRLSNNQVRVSWTGDPRPIGSMTMSLLDSNHRVLKSQTVTNLPAQATFTRSRTAAYYRVNIEYVDGAVRSLTSPL